MNDAILDDAMDHYATGDDAAFAIVYDRLAPRLTSFLVERTRDRALAEDLTQQTFLQMHCARETYVTGAPVAPWAFAIARRLVIDAFRKRQREVIDADASSELRDDDDPERRLLTSRHVAHIADALAGLPASQRRAFALLKLEGRSLAEAAVAMGKSVLAVKLCAHRAYVSVRAAAES